MLNDFNGANRVYIVCGYTDFRRGIDGLAVPIQTSMENGLDPYNYLSWLLRKE